MTISRPIATRRVRRPSGYLATVADLDVSPLPGPPERLSLLCRWLYTPTGERCEATMTWALEPRLCSWCAGRGTACAPGAEDQEEDRWPGADAHQACEGCGGKGGVLDVPKQATGSFCAHVLRLYAMQNL